MPAETALDDFMSLYNGLDIDLEVTETAQTVVTHYPRQGGISDVVLVLGGNIVTYDLPSDSRDVASSVIVQADGSGADREEGYASSGSALDGLMLEQVVYAENETPVTELTETAQQHLARMSSPQLLLEMVSHPRAADDLYQRVGKGDVVRAVVSDDPVSIDALYRVIDMDKDPNTDQIVFRLQPEEA